MKLQKKFNYKIAVLKGIFGVLFIFALTFLLAGTLDYWQGWIFCFVMVVVVAVSLILFKNSPDLAQERMKPGPNTKWWDKIILAIYGLLSFGILVLAVLDAGRFHWSIDLPIYIYVLNYFFFLLSIAIFTWAMKVNKFFSSVVRIQQDRGQQVIQTGPYGIVRHPGYVGAILMGLTMGLIFGSVWSLIPGAISGLLMIVRTYLEDETMKKELPGYLEYVKKTKYRLLPGIW